MASRWLSVEVEMMLMRTDPFRELDRLSQQLMGSLGTAARPSAMPMDAWRAGEEFVVEFDLPGWIRSRWIWTWSAMCSPCGPSGRR